MSRKKACKSCKYFYAGDECSNCKGNQSVTNWKGRIYIIDTEKSNIAEKVGFTKDGEYAIKVT